PWFGHDGRLARRSCARLWPDRRVRGRGDRFGGHVMAAFSVDLESLLAAVDRMSQFDGQLEQSLARAKSSVESLGLSWQGDAANAQQTAQTQWNDGADELRAALGQLRDIAERAHANYSGAADVNNRMWS